MKPGGKTISCSAELLAAARLMAACNIDWFVELFPLSGITCKLLPLAAGMLDTTIV
jgi:hypothetical protein